MLAILFALIAFLGWGTGDIFTTFATRKLGSYSSSFYGYFWGLVLFTLFIPFELASLKLLTFPMVLLTIFLSIVQLFAWLSYNEALKIGNSSLVGTIGGSFTSVVVILSLLFLGETLSYPEGVTVIVIFIGLFLSSIHIPDLINRRSIANKGTMLALVAMIGWAIYFTFIKVPVSQAGFFWPSYITTLTGTVSFFVSGFKRIQVPKVGIKTGFWATVLCGTLLTVGSFAFDFAISKGLSSVVAPIAGAYPALFALLAYIIFKDPITRQQKIGMIITLAGIIALAYFGA